MFLRRKDWTLSTVMRHVTTRVQQALLLPEWRQHLTTRLSGSFLVLSLLSVGITGGATFFRAQASLQQSAFDQLKVVTTLKQNEINRWFEDQQRIFLSISRLPLIKSQYRVLLEANTNLKTRAAAHQLMEQYLTSLNVSQANFTEVSILDRSDRVILSTQPNREGTYESSADLTYFEEVKPGKPTTPIFYTSTTANKLVTTFATPLRDTNGERLGLLIAHLNLDRLSQIVKAQKELGQSIDVYLIGSVEGNHTLVSSTLNNTPIGQIIASDGVNAVMRGVNGFGLYQNYAQTPVIGVYQNLSDIGLSLLAEQPQAISNLPAQDLAHQIVILGFLLSGLLSVGLYYFVRRAVHPILQIAQTATQVAAGDLEQRAPVLTNDEVGVLARKFNYMIEQLQFSRHQSEIYSQSLEQKAQELQTALQEVSSTQAQLVQSEKMSSLGQLVAGVAHEINNPVNFIHGNLGHLESYTQDLVTLVQLYQQSYPTIPPTMQTIRNEIEFDFLVEDVAKILNSMKVGTNRIREIVLSLRNFSRLDEAEFKAVNIHEGIDSTLMILQHRLKASSNHPEIQVIKQYGSLPLVECYPGQLNQVFMNLLTNAIDALEDATRDRPLQSMSAPNTIWIQTQQIVADRVRITIADNGMGIPEAVRSRLFDPFFTTKPVGTGTGLGLSISYQIVTEKHHGKIGCDSTLGQGSKFVIEIPVHQPGA